jgi:hypothetical protein
MRNGERQVQPQDSVERSRVVRCDEYLTGIDSFDRARL